MQGGRSRHTVGGRSTADGGDLCGFRDNAVVGNGQAAERVGGEPQTGAAPIYSMAATFPVRQAVRELRRRCIDKLYEVKR